MSLTNEAARYLLELKKVLSNPNQQVDLRNKKNRLTLIAQGDSNYTFGLEITSNKKFILKTAIHHWESRSFIGLLRIDFNGVHRNPVEIKGTCPEYLNKYAGKWFSPKEPHMHVYVESYRPLAWAIPLSDTPFPIKEMKTQYDLSDLIFKFAKEINLISDITIQGAIL
ncbi:MAG: hypothetical protein V6Z82_00950 [Flavobacteriales bacterium]